MQDIVRFVTPATALLVLAGCTSGLSAPTASELALACPRVSIVSGLDTVTKFRPGPGRDAGDIAARGQLVDFMGNCEYGGDGVTVNVSVLLAAEKGPALAGNEANFRYFVAVFRPGESTPAQKAEFDAPTVFPAGQARVASREDLKPRIPLPRDENAKNWSVAIGFQLTPEERDYNLTQEAKARAAR